MFSVCDISFLKFSVTLFAMDSFLSLENQCSKSKEKEEEGDEEITEDFINIPIFMTYDVKEDDISICCDNENNFCSNAGENYIEPMFLSKIKFGVNKNHIDVICSVIDDFIKDIPDFIKNENQNEAFYHTLVFLLIKFSGLDLIASDAPVGDGRVDIKFYNSNRSEKYCFEFKFNKAKTEDAQKDCLIEALNQIFDRKYCESEALSLDQNKINLAAISFFGNNAVNQINQSGFDNIGVLSCYFNKPNVTTKAFNLSGKEICNYEEFKAFCLKDNYNIFDVKKFDLSQVSCHGEPLIVGLSNMKKYLIDIANSSFDDCKEYHVSLFFEYVRSIVSSIGYSQKVYNKEYFLMIIYTMLISAGFSVNFKNNFIVVSQDGCMFCFGTSLINGEEIQDKEQFYAESLLKIIRAFACGDKNRKYCFVNININKSSDSSITDLILNAVCSYNEKFYHIDGNIINSTLNGEYGLFLQEVINKKPVPMPSTDQKRRVRPRTFDQNAIPPQGAKRLRFDSSSE